MGTQVVSIGCFATIVLILIEALVLCVETGLTAVARGGTPEAEIDRGDEHDRTIGRHGDLVGCCVASAGMVGLLILTILEADCFWIAGLALSFVVAMIVSSVVRPVACPGGLRPWAGPRV